jgi:hypothetical protein
MGSTCPKSMRKSILNYSKLGPYVNSKIASQGINSQLLIMARMCFVDNETEFFSIFAGFFSRNSREKSGAFSFGKLRRARRAALEPSPGRAGPHWNFPYSAVAHMVGGPWQL